MLDSYQVYRREYSRLFIVELSFIISDVTQSFVVQFVQNLQNNNIFGFSVFFSPKIVQISIFKVEYLENGLADFKDFALILQDFERPFRWNELVLALQFSFKELAVHISIAFTTETAERLQ